MRKKIRTRKTPNTDTFHAVYYSPWIMIKKQHRTVDISQIYLLLWKSNLKHLLKHLNQQSIKKWQRKTASRQFQQDEVIRITKDLPKNKALLSKTFQLKSGSTRFTYTLKPSRKIFSDCVKGENFPDIFDITIFWKYSYHSWSILILHQFLKKVIRQTKVAKWSSDR